MSTFSLKNDFLSFYRLPPDLTPHYITDKYKYVTPESNKGVRINGTLYKTTEKVRNTVKLTNALRRSAVTFRSEKTDLLKYIESVNDGDTANVSMMFDQLGNGLITYFIDFVIYFSSMPVTDQSMSRVIAHSSTHMARAYNSFTQLKDDYGSSVNTIGRNANTRYNSYNLQTQLEIDAAPTFSRFIGNSYSGLFGIEHVFGTVITSSSYTQGDAYIAMAKNKAKARFERKEDLRALKREALYSADEVSTELMKSFHKGLKDIVHSNMGYLFDSDALFYDGLENRPYDDKLWIDEIKKIKRDDWRKLKYLFDYYDVNYDASLQTPLFDKLLSQYGENGDFDAYNGDDLELYYLIAGCTTLKGNFAFQTYLKNYIIQKIDHEFEKINLDTAGKTDELFADIYNSIDKNEYLDAQRISWIKQHISSKRAALMARRGY